MLMAVARAGIAHRTVMTSLIAASDVLHRASAGHSVPRVPVWSRDGMVVIGDAAHAVGPDGRHPFYRGRRGAGDVPDDRFERHRKSQPLRIAPPSRVARVLRVERRTARLRRWVRSRSGLPIS